MITEEIEKSLEKGDGKEAVMRLAEEIDKINTYIQKLKKK